MSSLSAIAQSAQPTNNILFKTRMIRLKAEHGTMFSIQVDDREYWLTAKHILTGVRSGPSGEVKEKSIALDVLDPVGDAIAWQTFQFAVIDPGKDIDIVVLVPTTKLQGFDIPSLKASSGGVGMGQECSFLGYPFANAWTATFQNSMQYKMPFIKSCHISGIIKVAGADVLVLDGINNAGFSGGPVLYLTGADQVVLGVIAGYKAEAGEVHPIQVPDVPTSVQAPDDRKPQTTKKIDVVDLNTGIVLAFGVNTAVGAIRKNPIGQPIATK
jgi:hypothetical protein